MASETCARAVDLLNEALQADGAAKVDHLRGLVELVVKKEPELLPEFLPQVLELQVDPSPPVRRFLADFVDAAVAARPCSPTVLRPSLQCLQALVGDEVPATAKRALQSCYAAFRTAYALVALRGAGGGDGSDGHDELPSLWAAAQALKAAVAAVAAAPAANDAARQAATKFVEQSVLLLTAELVPAVAGVSSAAAPLPPGNAAIKGGKAALVRDAEALLAQLVTLLKQRLGDGGLAAPLAAAAVRAAGGIVQQRPQFIGKLLPPLLALANSGAFKAAAEGGTSVAGGADLPGSGAVVSALKGALTALARSSQPAAQPWKKKLVAALDAMGFAAEAPPLSLSDRADKRLAAPTGNGVDTLSKRQRLDGQPLQAEASVVHEQQQQEQQQQQQQRVTPPDQLAKVLAVLQALVAKGDAVTLAGVIGSLQPAVLADVVVAYMQNLPPPHMVLPDSAPWEPWVDQLLQLVANQATLPSLGAPPGTATATTQQQQQRAASPAVLWQQDVQQQAAATQARPDTFVKPAKLQPIVLLVAAFRLEPVPLTQKQLQHLHLAAILRILRTDKTSRQQLRTALVAKLAAQADPMMAPAILQHLLQGISSSGEVPGTELEVAMQWLNMLYAMECQPLAGEDGRGGDDEPPALAGSVRAGGDSVADVARAGDQRHPPSISPPGSVYENTLMQLLDGLKDRLPPSSRIIVRVLLEAPALPMPAVQQFLQQMTDAGSDWCTLALLAARDVILQRPPCRSPLLEMVLAACASPMADTRSKAVRLVANRLFPDVSMGPQIELAARQRLDELIVVHGTAGEPLAENSAAPLQQQQQQLEQQQQDVEQRPSDDLQQETGAEGEELPQQTGPSDAEAAQLCALYCALCTKKHSLLRHLFEVYGQTSDGGRTAIQRNAGGLAKTLGASAAALLAVVQDPPPGGLPLVLQMLHVLTEATAPPQLLAVACLQLYSSCRDARVLLPALRGLDRATALRMLPALLDLQPEQLRPALQRLVVPLAAALGPGGQEQPSVPAVLSPEELLSALHTLENSQDIFLLRKIMQAITVCISSPALFPPESLAACINQLLTRVPLPQLFMRTVIQTASAAPRLRAFVISVLRQLVAKQIWKDTTQWKGWIMCAQQTVPESFPLLLSLPPDILGTAVQTMPAKVQFQLKDYAVTAGAAVPETARLVIEQLTPPVDAPGVEA